VLAPGLLANGGLEATSKGEFAKAGLSVALDVADTASQVEKALARGGADEDGADVAIVPLPTLVAAWERLRALNLAAFHVVAWSRGRESILTKHPLTQLPAQGELTFAGAPGDAATFLGLFALEKSGIELGRVSFEDKPSALVTTLSKGDKRSDDAKPAKATLSTSEASRLIPWVAVAQRSLVTGQPETLIAWAKAWHAGLDALHKDAATAARTIGNLDGAPEPLTLLERLGELAPVTLAENAELFALSGRSAVTLETLFDACWHAWKETRVLGTPQPERAPLSDRIVAGLARAEPKLLEVPDASDAKPKRADGKPRTILVRVVRGAALDDEAVIAELGMLAGIFHRSAIALSVHGVPKKKHDEIVSLAVDRYALDRGRVSAGKAPARPSTQATIEIFEPR
jgi:hypothetical protein